MTATKRIIGTRVRIEYFDQNENFAPLLPRSGAITGQLHAGNGVDDWFLVELEEAFDYQIKIAEPFKFRLLHCERLLLRSRWRGHGLGETEPTSVFILLIPDDALLARDPIPVEDFHHVAWGMCHTQ